MSRYRQTMSEALKQVYKEQDEKDHEISMARGELEAIADKATQLAGALQGKSDEGNPLEAWVQSKITKAKDYINSVSDYLMYNPDMKQNEETELEEAKIISDISGVGINVIKKEVMPFNVKVGRVSPGMDSDYEVEFTGSEPNLIKYAKKHLDFDGNNFSQLKKHLAMEETEVNEKTYGWTLVSKAKDLAKKFKDNMTKAVDEIEKLEKGLSKNPVVYKELLKYNEEVELDEGKMSKIDALVKQGKSSDEIAKLMNLNVRTVKDILGEEKEEPKEEPKEDSKKEENKESEIQSLKDQIAMLKQKLENEKNKAIKPEPNPETGEVPLTIGIAHAEFKKEKEKKEVKEENLQELSKAERDKRIQRAKDMIKYYDAQKKAALKGPNKALAKKMLKNDVNEARFEVEGRVDYKGVSGGDDFSIVVDAPNEKAAEKKVEDMLFKHRDQRKIGPRGGRGVDDYEIESVERTSKSVTNKFSTYHAAENDPSIEEALEIKEFTSQMIDRLKKSFSTAPKRISPEQANKLSKHLDRIELNDLRKLVKANIPFVSTVARNKIYKKTGKFEETNLEDRRLYVEAIAGLQKKADKSGMPYSILKKVYDRGMAAWKSGHRPGASQQQWAFARVNSFVTKSSGTWGGADKDLAKQVKGK